MGQTELNWQAPGHDESGASTLELELELAADPVAGELAREDRKGSGLLPSVLLGYCRCSGILFWIRLGTAGRGWEACGE